LLKSYHEPRLPRGIGICNLRNVDDVLADHRTALEIVQKDHQTKWPIHNRPSPARFLRLSTDFLKTMKTKEGDHRSPNVKTKSKTKDRDQAQDTEANF
jgi:hypothetical protein